MNRLQQAPPSFVASLYFSALFLVAGPVAFEIQRIWPFRPGELEWRFGAEGFLLSALTLPLLGFTVATALAFVRGNRGPQRLIAVLGLLVVLLSAAVLVAFVIDLRAALPGVPLKAVPVMKAAAVRTIISAGLAVLAATTLAIGGWRASFIRS